MLHKFHREDKIKQIKIAFETSQQVDNSEKLQFLEVCKKCFPKANNLKLKLTRASNTCLIVRKAYVGSS